jgi:hypothetical protein
MIGILYICTGKYDVFWKGFFLSAEKNFLAGQEKRYFVFTDAEHLYAEDSPKVQKIYQETLGWPFNTLLRFKMFLNAEAELKKCDYLFFFNANVVFIEKVENEILPDDSNDGLLAVLHPGFWDKNNQEFTYDRNVSSTAYIPFGEGKHYFMGGVNGGKTDAYLQLIKTLNNNIQKDLEKDVMALWHDESHLNHYLLNKDPKILSPEYGYSEEDDLPFKPKIIIINKFNPKYGGLDYLRNLTDVKTTRSSLLIQKFSNLMSKFSRRLAFLSPKNNKL